LESIEEIGKLFREEIMFTNVTATIDSRMLRVFRGCCRVCHFHMFVQMEALTL
jgi:hypothetical protein